MSGGRQEELAALAGEVERLAGDWIERVRCSSFFLRESY